MKKVEITSNNDDFLKDLLLHRQIGHKEHKLLICIYAGIVVKYNQQRVC